MKASARNQLHGTIDKVIPGAVNAEVLIKLDGGSVVAASVTNPSIDELGLVAGKKAVALVKAPYVVLVKDTGGFKLSARNQLPGTVDKVVKGAVNAEVILKLQGGDSIAAIITNESVEGMELNVGDAATAVFKAGAVIVGVAV